MTTDMTVRVPEGTSGSVSVRRFEVSVQDAKFHNLRELIHSSNRDVVAGTYTGLYRNGYLWMSDTPAERRDHVWMLHQTESMCAKRVLVNGLGIGMVVQALLAIDTVEHIDAVEVDADVIALVGPHYEAAAAAAGKTLTIHHHDALTITWPPGVRWDVAWHDIWADASSDNLPSMGTLHRRYGRRVRWQDSWARDEIRAHMRRYGW